MKKLVLLLCAMPIVAMREYQPLVEMEVMGEASASVTPQSLAQHYQEARAVLFKEPLSQVFLEQERLLLQQAEERMRNFIEQRDAQTRSALSDLGVAVQANYKLALYDAAELALSSDLSMEMHTIIMSILTSRVSDSNFKSKNNLSAAEIMGLKLLAEGDTLSGDYDSRKLALQKIAMLQNLMVRKERYCAQDRAHRIGIKGDGCCFGICTACTVSGEAAGGGAALAILFNLPVVGKAAVAGVIAGSTCAGCLAGTAAGYALGKACTQKDGCPIKRYINNSIPDKFIEVENVISEILESNPAFISNAVAELDTLATIDKKAAALLQAVYDKGLLVERDEARAQRYAQLAQPVSEPHAETAA